MTSKKPTPGADPDPVFTGTEGEDTDPIPEPDVASITPADLQGPAGFALFASFMGKLVDKMTAAQVSPAALKDILTETGKVNAELARKAKWPENPDHPHISAYSYPEGDVLRPKPKLKRETFFCGYREDEERLTPGEIEAFNAIDGPLEARGGSWRAVVKKPLAKGGKETLEIYVPKDSVDQRMVLPSLHLILHELNGGPSTEDIMTLVKQIEGLKALLAAKGATAEELEAAMLSSPFTA